MWAEPFLRTTWFFSAVSEMISILIERIIGNLEERMRVSERVTQVFLRAFRLPGRRQLQAAAAAAVPAGELVVTAQLPFAAVPLTSCAPTTDRATIMHPNTSTQAAQMRPNSLT